MAAKRDQKTSTGKINSTEDSYLLKYDFIKKHMLERILRFEHTTSHLYILYPVVVSIIFNTYCCLWTPMVTTVQIDDDLKKRLNLLKIHP